MWDSDDRSLQDSTNILLRENQLQKYGKFLFGYTSKLNKLEKDHFDHLTNIKKNYIKIKLLYHDENRNKRDEKKNIVNLIDTENVIYNKIVLIFTHLNKQINFIVNEFKNKHYNLILYYGEMENKKCPEVQMSTILGRLQELTNLVQYTCKIFNETLKQLNSIYHFQWNNKHVGDNSASLFDVFLSLSELLVSFVTLDEIVASQSLFNDHWNVYKQAVICEMQSNAFNLDSKKVKLLHKMMLEIENILLSGNVFSNALNMKFNDLTKNLKLSISMLNYIKSNINKFESKLLSELTYHKCLHFMKICMLYVFHIETFGMRDKKLFRQVWECFKKFTSITIYCNIVWFPDDFFQRHLSEHVDDSIEKRNVHAIRSLRDNYILQSHENMYKEVNIYNIYVLSWIVKFDQLMKKDISLMRLNEIKEMVSILHDGVTLSGKIKRILINITNLYYRLNKPIVKNNVIYICKLAESLKFIESSFENHFIHICKIFNKIISFQQYQGLTLVNNIKKYINPNKHAELLNSLGLVERLLKGACSNDKLLIIKHALAFNRNSIREDDLNNLYKCVNQLSVSYNLENIIQDNCDLSFLYFHKNLINIYIRNNGASNLHIKYISDIISDVCVSSSDKDIYLNEIQSNIIAPLCTSIENNVRLHSHHHLQVEKLTLDKIEHDFNHMFLLNPELFLIQNEFVDIKNKMENYLDKTFYDLTTIALHNFKTYNEMRNIAKYKFELSVIENNLPSKTLDNGIDILFLIRNINSFVNNYNYNINNQIFIENKSNSKFLNTITISHIANNIRIYGIGIINTLINYIYQYLCKKLNLLIKYLYNENIKSKLIKEIKFFRENKLQLNQKYPFDRAEKLSKSLRSIHEERDVSDENGHLNYLERFRVLITQVGNAIGLIRMIRSGSLHYCANSVQFVPNLKKGNDIKQHLSSEESTDDQLYRERITHKLSPHTEECLKNFNSVLEKSIHSLEDSTDYFKLIINVFKPLLANTNIKHVYILIPSLIYHYVQYIVKIKEKVSKIKSNITMSSEEILNFTDDGFILGLSYLIKIFNINHLYNSLDFYSSVMEKYRSSPLENKFSVNNVDSLTLKTSQLYLNQFLLFYYNLNSVHVFFDQY